MKLESFQINYTFICKLDFVELVSNISNFGVSIKFGRYILLFIPFQKPKRKKFTEPYH